jgi:transcriptional regulator with XRE-family HTH domain
MGGVERGERNLTLKSLERMAGLVGVDPLDLIDTQRVLPVSQHTGAQAPS